MPHKRRSPLAMQLQQVPSRDRLGPGKSMHITSHCVTPIDSEILPQVQHMLDSSSEPSFRSNAPSTQREPYMGSVSEWGLVVQPLQSPTPRSDATVPSSTGTPEPSTRREAPLTQRERYPTLLKQTTSSVQVIQTASTVLAQQQTAMADVQPTADSTPETSSRQEAAAVQPDLYAKRVTEEGVTVQTLVPPMPDPAQAVAGRMRRARAALAARTRQMHGPLPMLPRKVPPRPQTAAPEPLSESMLLQAAQVQSPDEVDVVRLSGRGLSCFPAEQLSAFCSLRYLDLSGNRLTSLQPVAALPALHTLLLSGNSVGSLTDCTTGRFQALEVLDLSFNSLQPDCLQQLGQWPQLRQLDLSGNQLARWYAPAGSFPLLRVLRAGCCSLQEACLQQLSTLPSLSELYLASNHIAKVPGLAATAAIKPFRQLQLLDLTSNKLAAISSIQPLLGLSSLRHVTLLNNPVAGSSAAFSRSFSNASITGGKIVVDRQATATTLSPGTDPLLIIDTHAEPVQTPSIAQCFPPELPQVADLPLQGMDVTSGALAFEFSHDRIAEAFDKLHDDIKQWSTLLADSPVPESSANGPPGVQPMQQQGDEISMQAVDRAEVQTAASEQGSAEAADCSRDTEDYGHITDPTIRLAVALGLSPEQLTIYNGRQGTDSASAVAALHFALEHPLTEADEGLQKVPHSHQTTRSIAAKQRTKVQPAAVQKPELPLSFRMDKIQTIEGILSGMKTRIHGLEKSLVSQLHKKKLNSLQEDRSNSQEQSSVDLSGNTSLLMPQQQ